MSALAIVPVKLAAGRFVSEPPDPENVVAESVVMPPTVPPNRKAPAPKVPAVIVEALCVPVCVVRSRSAASVAFAVNPLGFVAAYAPIVL